MSCLVDKIIVGDLVTWRGYGTWRGANRIGVVIKKHSRKLDGIKSTMLYEIFFDLDHTIWSVAGQVKKVKPTRVVLPPKQNIY